MILKPDPFHGHLFINSGMLITKKTIVIDCLFCKNKYRNCSGICAEDQETLAYHPFLIMLKNSLLIFRKKIPNKNIKQYSNRHLHNYYIFQGFVEIVPRFLCTLKHKNLAAFWLIHRGLNI